MRTLQLIFILIAFSPLYANQLAQEQATTPTRTPEQVAAMQTQKMQQELDLSQEQAQTVYEINLRHARQRQVSNSRTQAVERIKNKDDEIKKVLTPDQYTRLQDKRYERYPSGSTTLKHNLPNTRPLQQRTNPAERRTPETQQRQSVRSSSQRSIRQDTPTQTRSPITSPDRSTRTPSVRTTPVNPRSTNAARPATPSRNSNTPNSSNSRQQSSPKPERR